LETFQKYVKDQKSRERVTDSSNGTNSVTRLFPKEKSVPNFPSQQELTLFVEGELQLAICQWLLRRPFKNQIRNQRVQVVAVLLRVIVPTTIASSSSANPQFNSRLLMNSGWG